MKPMPSPYRSLRTLVRRLVDARGMTISRRLAIAAATAVAVAIALASIAAYFAVKAQLLGQVDSSLRQRAGAIERFAPAAATSAGAVATSAGTPAASAGAAGASAGAVTRSGGTGAGPKAGSTSARPTGMPPGLSGVVLPPLPQSAKRFGGATGVVQLVTPAGKALRPRGQTGTALPVDAATRAVAGGGSSTVIEDETVEGHRLRVLTAPLSKGGAVEVALPLAGVESTLSGLAMLLLAITAGGVALAALLGLLVARAALRPVRRFTARTEEIASELEPLGRRLPSDSRDELGRLARSYNSTLAALERSVAAQRRLVSDASHELRTPLTSLRANLEVLIADRRLPDEDRRELNGDLIDQVDELTRLVEEIVELARNGEQRTCRIEVELADVVLGAVEQVRPHAGAVAFEVDVERAGTVLGDGARLMRAVRNLLENAVKWSPQGGTIEVAAVDGAVTVRDHGRGIGESDLPHVFERFYRAPDSRRMPGSGLGLAIVGEVVAAHGGVASAGNAPGGGALMTLTLPIAELEGPEAALAAPPGAANRPTAVL
jgi:two-component system, OmpR family, sensor histidine kinase MprB